MSKPKWEDSSTPAPPSRKQVPCKLRDYSVKKCLGSVRRREDLELRAGMVVWILYGSWRVEWWAQIHSQAWKLCRGRIEQHSSLFVQCSAACDGWPYSRECRTGTNGKRREESSDFRMQYRRRDVQPDGANLSGKRIRREINSYKVKFTPTHFYSVKFYSKEVNLMLVHFSM